MNRAATSCRRSSATSASTGNGGRPATQITLSGSSRRPGDAAHDEGERLGLAQLRQRAAARASRTPAVPAAAARPGLRRASSTACQWSPGWSCQVARCSRKRGTPAAAQALRSMLGDPRRERMRGVEHRGDAGGAQIVGQARPVRRSRRCASPRPRPAPPRSGRPATGSARPSRSAATARARAAASPVPPRISTRLTSRPPWPTICALPIDHEHLDRDRRPGHARG